MCPIICTMPLFLSTLSLRRATSREYAKKYRPYISIHALLAESDLTQTDLANRAELFLSTLSLRRATDLKYKRDQTILFLSTLSLRRATCDTLSALAPEQFLSTLSLRRATLIGQMAIQTIHISIHALLAESDHTS